MNACTLIVSNNYRQFSRKYYFSSNALRILKRNVIGNNNEIISRILR